MKLLELIQPSLLYHFTSFEKFLKIIQTNELIPNHSAASTSLTTNPKLINAKTVSFTRNKTLDFYSIRLDFDRQKLLNRYKIFVVRPDDEFGDLMNKTGPGRYWQEEIIINNVTPIKKYLVNAQLIIDRPSMSYFTDVDVNIIKKYFKLNRDPKPTDIKKMFTIFCIKNHIPHTIV